MKRLITPLMFLAIFIVAGIISYAVISHRNQYLSIQTAQEQAAETKKAEDAKKQIEAQRAERVNLVKQYNQLRAECAKGQAAFTKLSLANQRLIGQPQCGDDIE